MQAHEVKARVEGRWYNILLGLGVDEKTLSGKHVPCPFCGGEDRFRFDDKGEGLYFCNQCGAGDGFRFVMQTQGWDFITAKKEVIRMSGMVEVNQKKEPSETEIRASLKKVWDRCTKAKPEDEVGKYLKGRGLTVFPEILIHPSLEYFGEKQGNFTAMVGAIRNVKGKIISLHRTYLYSGKKAPVDTPKKTMKGVEKISGCAIRLFPVDPLNKILAIAEGIETACAVTELTGVPCWSVISAGGMRSFEVPTGVNALKIYADNDSNFTGQEAAYALANRVAPKLHVEVHIAPLPDSDWLDILNMPHTQEAQKIAEAFNGKVVYAKESGKEFGRAM